MGIGQTIHDVAIAQSVGEEDWREGESITKRVRVTAMHLPGTRKLILGAMVAFVTRWKLAGPKSNVSGEICSGRFAE